MRPFYFYSQTNVAMAPGELTVVKDIFGEGSYSDLIYEIPEDSIVIPRFRSIPFGEELDREIQARGSKLINSYREHRAIADLFNWVNLLHELTPKAYTVDELPHIPEGEYFVKGETNSKKNRWFESAYASNKAELMSVIFNLQGDQYVGTQKLAIRPFQHYRKLGEGVDGRPIFHERRIFVLDGKIVSEGFYWSSFADEFGDTAILNQALYENTLAEAIARVKHLARFIVIDLAEYPDGSWGVIELNDGCMSGISENDPTVLWSNIYKELS